MPYQKDSFNLKNHVIMAPMTRSRAIENIPNELMAQYYGQRASAGLIITEGTAPAAEALGYPRIPGVFNQTQIDGWKKVTNEVHNGNGKIFIQLMHTGRIGHVDNLPKGLELVGASDRKAAGQIFTDTKGMQDHGQPVALSHEGIQKVINAYVQASLNAMEAGFDGVELHGANGYLLEQFLNPNVNNRNDEYGGDIANRGRLVLEVVNEVASVIGKDKVGIRFSPFSTLGDLQPYAEDDVKETYAYLATEINKIGIVYIHIASNPAIPQETLELIRKNFTKTLILSSGFTPETGETALQNGFADLIAFGRSFLANPDFVERIITGVALNQPDFTTLYTPGPNGYIDYPLLADELK